jgi:hypothetical protein
VHGLHHCAVVRAYWLTVRNEADYTNAAAGFTSVAPNTISARVTVTHNVQAMPATVHLNRTNTGPSVRLVLRPLRQVRSAATSLAGPRPD